MVIKWHPLFSLLIEVTLALPITLIFPPFSLLIDPTFEFAGILISLLLLFVMNPIFEVPDILIFPPFLLSIESIRPLLILTLEYSLSTIMGKIISELIVFSVEPSDSKSKPLHTSLQTKLQDFKHMNFKFKMLFLDKAIL